MKRTLRVLAGSLLIALAPPAWAQAGGNDVDTQVSALDQTAANRGQSLVAGKIASNFTRLAGSEDNALALVKALRAGETVNLTYPAEGTGTAPTVSAIDPPTSRMGWGNVKISLALAQDVLARAGITNPTGEQLQAALNGGDITVTNADGTTSTVTLKGVLQMRADGMGWGQIAKASGTRVGPVVSQLRMANSKVAALPLDQAGPKAAAVSTPKSKGVTTAAGFSPTRPKSRGITTATGTDVTAGGKPGSKGITTASGAAGSRGSRGLVTAEGAASAPKGQGYGRGVVTAGGGSVTNTSASRGRGQGAGVLTAGGNQASSVTTANANAGGNGKGQGAGKGKGPGGG